MRAIALRISREGVFQQPQAVTLAPWKLFLDLLGHCVFSPAKAPLSPTFHPHSLVSDFLFRLGGFLVGEIDWSPKTLSADKQSVS
jgi:hypothetical protein